MNSDNEADIRYYKARIYDLNTSIGELLRRGDRDRKKVADLLQTIVDGACRWDYLGQIWELELDLTEGGFPADGWLKNVFSEVDPRIRKIRSLPTPQVRVTGSKIIRPGHFSDFLGNPNEATTFLSWVQIVTLYEAHPEKFGRPSYFLTTEDGELPDEHYSNVLVIHVNSDRKVAPLPYSSRMMHDLESQFVRRQPR